MRSDKWTDTALSWVVDRNVYLNKKYIFFRNLHDVGMSLILNLATVITTNFWITSPYAGPEPSNQNHIFRIVHFILVNCKMSFLLLYYCTNVNKKVSQLTFMKILRSLEISDLGSKIFSSLTYLKQQKTNVSVEEFMWHKNEAQL